MSTVGKNPGIKTRSAEVRESLAMDIGDSHSLDENGKPVKDQSVEEQRMKLG